MGDFDTASVEDLELFLLEEKVKHATQSYHHGTLKERVEQVLQDGSAEQLRELLVKPDDEIIRDLWRRCQRILEPHDSQDDIVKRETGDRILYLYLMVLRHVRSHALDIDPVELEEEDLLEPLHPVGPRPRRRNYVRIGQSHPTLPDSAQVLSDIERL